MADSVGFGFAELLSTSSVIKNWQKILVAVLLIFVLHILYKKLRQKLLVNVQNQKLKKNYDDIAVEFDGYTQEVELKPALPETSHVQFIMGKNMNPHGARKFYELVNGRRSIRNFSKQTIPFDIIEDCIRAAGTAPSGAHTEPWTYCVVKNNALKESIREIVEKEEYLNYKSRMHPQWVTDLRPLQTKHIKEYLTDAPYLILIFKQIYGQTSDGRKKLHYYNEISTSIAAGILLCALQAAGICSLVSTPLNCGGALRNILHRPDNEKLLILLAVGYAAPECRVPDLQRKPLQDIMATYL